MKTARDYYPETSDEVFEKASDWVCETYSYVPYMEPARNGFIAGWDAARRDSEIPLDTKNANFIGKLLKKRKTAQE